MRKKHQIIQNSQKNSQISYYRQMQINNRVQTILVQNKRLIYKSKINTYTKQIQKIQKMIMTKKHMREQKNFKMQEDDDDDDSYSDDQDQQVGLINKLKYIQQKKQQAMDKLSMIDKIQQDIKSLQLSRKQQNGLQSNRSELMQQKNINQQNKIKNNNKLFINKQNLQSFTLDLKNKINNNQFFNHLSHYQDQYYQSTNPNQWISVKKDHCDILKNSEICLSVNTSIYRKLEKSQEKQMGESLHKNWATQVIDQMGTKKHVIKKSNIKDKQLQIDKQGESNESMLLWSDRETPMDKTSKDKKKKLIKIDDILKNNTKSQSTTPISIKNIQFKINNNNQQIISNNTQNAIIFNQVKIIMHQLQSILSIIHYNHLYPKINNNNNITDEDENKIVFKLINQYLIKIKQFVNFTINKQKSEYLLFQQQIKFNLQQLKNQQIYRKSSIAKIQQQYNIYCKSLQQKSQQYSTLLKKVQQIEKYKKQLQIQLKTIINSYEENLKNISTQLQQLSNEIMVSMTERERNNIKDVKQFPKKQFKRVPHNKKQPKHNEQINSNIIKMYQFIRMIVQSQKLTILQNKQMILSHQYNINILKGQQNDLQNNINLFKNNASKISNQVQDLILELNKLTKQKQKICKDIQQCTAQSQSYQNLAVIRRNCYNELQTKYNTLKTKKTKIENALKSMQKQQSQKKQGIQKLQKNLTKQKNSLQNINEQIIQKLKNKQQLTKQLQTIDNQFIKQNQNLKNIQSIINKKNQIISNNQNILNQFYSNIQICKNIQINKKSDIDKLQQSIKQILQSHKQKQQSLYLISSKLSQLQSSTCKKKDQFQKLSQQQIKKQQNIKILQQSHKQLQKKIKIFNDDIKKLQIAKNDLQQTLVVILQKKQQSMKILTFKYSELEALQQQTQQLKISISALTTQKISKVNQVKQLSSNIINLQQQLNKIHQLMQSTHNKLSNLLNQLQFNRDEQQNLMERITKLKSIQTKLLLQIAIKSYEKQPTNKDKDMQLYTLLPIQIKQQIQLIIKQLYEVNIIKQKFYKEKQQNRKLKLDNDRLMKFCQMDSNLQQNLYV